MNEINFESKGEKLYVVKLDDTAIGRLLKNKEGSWKISSDWYSTFRYAYEQLAAKRGIDGNQIKDC